MRKFLYPIILLNLGGITYLPAETTRHSPSTFSSKTEQVEKNESGDRDQKQIAAWMIEALQVSRNYVESLDKGQYIQSWSKGDALFQRTITQEQWEKVLESSRKSLGKVKSRTLKDERLAWDPHGLPKGPYMVVEYTTSFEHAPDSIELLTLRRGTDGNWRVLTYNIN